MTTQSELFARSGDLKRDLVRYADSRQFAEARHTAQIKRFGESSKMPESETINFIDWFILQHRLPDGTTIVERFVSEHPELSLHERQLLLGWRDVIHSLFEIEAHKQGAMACLNLVDDLTYRIRSNFGDEAIKQFMPGSFINARIVPVGDEWMLSGTMQRYSRAQRADIYRAALEIATKAPHLVFRNPEKLKQGWEMQRKDREDFISFFGADLVVIPAAEFAERMRAYMHYKMFDVRDDDGLTVAERSRQIYGRDPKPVESPMPDWGWPVETVGLIYDEREGMNYFPDYHLVIEAFENPELARDDPYREALLGYIQGDELSGLPIRRLADRDPERASQVFRILFSRPRFSWRRDGEKFLRRYKAHLDAKEPLPSVTPIHERLTRAQLATTEKRSIPLKKLKPKSR